MIYLHKYSKNKELTHISECAVEDLRGYFKECVFDRRKYHVLDRKKDVLVLSNWRKVLGKVRSKDSGKDKRFSGCNDAMEFVGLLLEWLEEKKRSKKPLWPWIFNKQTKKLEIGNCEIEGFIIAFKNILDSFCITDVQRSNDALSRYVLEQVVDVSELRNFINYLAKTKIDPRAKWSVRLIPIKAMDKVFSNMLSWLVVDQSNKVLNILYAIDIIKQGTRNKFEIVSRLEKIFLHEIGRARLNLTDWRISKLVSNRPQSPGWWLEHPEKCAVVSPAEQAFMAWAYAFSIRSYLKSFRSWITILLREVDDEWRNP